MSKLIVGLNFFSVMLMFSIICYNNIVEVFSGDGRSAAARGVRGAGPPRLTAFSAVLLVSVTGYYEDRITISRHSELSCVFT